MGLTSLTMVIGAMLAGMSTVTGQVVDGAGAPIPGAQVFIEPGLAQSLVSVQASPEGRFQFEEIAPGSVGVFAVADGYAFGGVTAAVPATGEAPTVTVCLTAPASVGGVISDFKGRPVSGARVTRVGLLGVAKVAIPLAKLVAFGIEEPVSDADGRFTVPRLPQGGAVALKVGHPDYAQEAVSDISVGDTDVRIKLQAGVVVRGIVRSRDQRLPVLQAGILVRNTMPPHDTSLAITDGSGAFALRLKPGVYLYQATGAALRTPGWEKLTVTGQEPMQQVSLTVAGVGTVTGKVSNALTGEGVAGARVLIESNGNVADIVTTGSTGIYESAVTEGDTVVRIEGAPGYHPPELAVQRVRAVESERVEVPPFWLAPIPAYTVQVVDEDMAPAPGVVVQVLRPEQSGWRVTDAQGNVSICVAVLPPDGLIVGAVEHPKKPLGALFALRREDSEGTKVQLFALGTVTGRAVSVEGRALPGAVVGAAFEEEMLPEPLWLWRTVADKDGGFTWAAVVPYVPLRCVAAMGKTFSGASAPLTLEPSERKDIGNIVIEGAAEPSKSLLGRPLKWYDGKVVCGTLPDKKDLKERPAWVTYCSAEEAPMVTENLAVARDILARRDIVFAVVVSGAYACESAPVPVLSGPAPGPATTYLVGADGNVAIETFGMPPVRAAANL